MMSPMHEMKASPLRDAERPEDEVGEAGSGAEEALGLGQYGVHAGKADDDCRGEVVSAGVRSGRTGGRRDDGRSFAAYRDKA